MTDNSLLSFRALCEQYWQCSGDALYRDVLRPAEDWARAAVAALSRYRDASSVADRDELHEWYALSRLNDLLIAALPVSVYVALPADVSPPALSLGDYEAFFADVGFDAIDPDAPFSPIFHEIVTVVEDAGVAVPTISCEHWRGWRFGQLIFARAGVTVACPPGYFNKTVAESSRLYFAYQRRNRVTSDLSHGWGSNSQWATAFRRDYDTGDRHRFNVDGKYPLGDEAAFLAALSPSDRAGDAEDAANGTGLTMAERIELLTHRSFVRTVKDDADRFPFNDSYSAGVTGE